MNLFRQQWRQRQQWTIYDSFVNTPFVYRTYKHLILSSYERNNIIDIRSVRHLRIVQCIQHVCHRCTEKCRKNKWCESHRFYTVLNFFSEKVMHEGGTRVNAHFFINDANRALQIKFVLQVFFFLFWHLFYDSITN